MRFSPARSKTIRRFVFHFLNGSFSYAFSKRAKKVSREAYKKIAELARQGISQRFLDSIENRFGVLPPREFVNELALTTQIVMKRSTPYYGHGYLLYSALRRYISDNSSLSSYTILETGTARGFSSVMMAKALDNANSYGKILSIDVLPSNVPMYWNCISDFEGKKTRFELLAPWSKLVEQYIIFLQGYSDFLFKGLGLSRIHFAFIDGSHEYEGVKSDAKFVTNHQQKGDIIIFDDYTPNQFPGVVKVVDDLIEGGEYLCEIIPSDTSRSYAYCVKQK